VTPRHAIVTSRHSGATFRHFSNLIQFSAILFIAFFDLLYGMFVSPFFVENYIDVHWAQVEVL
jgi:hypothetical protein